MANEKRLTDANALMDCFEKEYKESTYPYFHINEIEDEIIKATTVDAVEVVRCKDCEFYNENRKRCDHPCLEWDVECYDLWLEVEPDDFCSYGERRDGQ